MLSQKPYLINAIYEWCEDNNLTPFIVVVVDKNASVPLEYVENGQIILNISSLATKHLNIDKIWCTFQAAFNGASRDISIPISNVIAIFAKENGQGMQFNLEPFNNEGHVISKKNNNELRLIK